MSQYIPKEIKTDYLTQSQIDSLTDIVFLRETLPQESDLLFVFAGTHPGHYEKAIIAYHNGLAPTVLVTGGVSPTGVKHKTWSNPDQSESKVIRSKLIEGNIPSDKIIIEDKSRNTLENVLYAKEIFDFKSIQSLLFICKNHAAGRQFRTLAKHIPSVSKMIPYGFDASYEGTTVTRYNWMNSEIGRKRVIGEYTRILKYGSMGHLLALEEEVPGILLSRN